MIDTPHALSDPLWQLSRRARLLAIVPLIAGATMVIGVIVLWLSADIRAVAFGSTLQLAGATLHPEAVNFPYAFWPTLLFTLPVLVFIGTMLMLNSLFRRMAHGQVFDARNAQLVSRSGLGFIAFALASIVCNTLRGLLLSASNPPGERVLSIGLNASDIGAFAAGFALLGLGLVLSEAARMADDHAGIV